MRLRARFLLLGAVGSARERRVVGVVGVAAVVIAAGGGGGWAPRVAIGVGVGVGVGVGGGIAGAVRLGLAVGGRAARRPARGAGVSGSRQRGRKVASRDAAPRAPRQRATPRGTLTARPRKYSSVAARHLLGIVGSAMRNLKRNTVLLVLLPGGGSIALEFRHALVVRNCGYVVVLPTPLRCA